MIHKVSELCDRVEAMAEEAKALRALKYSVPKLQRDNSAIDQKIAQIQYMALLIAKDTTPYEKKDD